MITQHAKCISISVLKRFVFGIGRSPAKIWKSPNGCSACDVVAEHKLDRTVDQKVYSGLNRFSAIKLRSCKNETEKISLYNKIPARLHLNSATASSTHGVALFPVALRITLKQLWLSGCPLETNKVEGFILGRHLYKRGNYFRLLVGQ